MNTLIRYRSPLLCRTTYKPARRLKVSFRPGRCYPVVLRVSNYRASAVAPPVKP